MNKPPKPDRDELAFDDAFSTDVYDAVPDVIYAFDRNWQFRRWNDRLLELTGYSNAEIAEMNPIEFIPEDEREHVSELVMDVLERGKSRSVDTTLLTKDGEPLPVEFNGSPVRAESGTIVGVAGGGRDISERKRRERELSQYETLFETVGDGVYVVDEDLRFVTVNEAFASMTGYDRETLEGSPISLVSSEAGLAKARRLADELRTSDREVANLDTDILSASGETVPTETRFSPLPDEDAGGIVGVTRDVTERRRRERKLRRQRDELETLNRINVVIRELTRSLVSTASREGIETTVVSQLADSNLYQFAWVAERDRTGTGLSVRSEAGEDNGVRSLVGEVVGEEDRPAAVALRTGETQVVNDPRVRLIPPESETALGESPVESGIAVPLSYGEATYGVLVVYATRPNAFSEREQAGFEALGDIVSFAINAVESRRLLFAESVVELEFAVTDRGALFVRLSDEYDCRCTLEDVLPAEEETMLCFVRVAGESPDVVLDAVEASDEVDSARLVSRGDDECVLEVRVTGPSPVVTLADHGASVTHAVAEGGEGRIVAELAPDADLRAVVEAVESAFPDAKMVGKRDAERPAGSAAEFRTALDDRLTDRQLTATRAAYRAGYFDWPRASTAEEVADALDISAATLHQHLRKSQEKLLDVFFGEPD
ncbi:PAS sensor protein [halophilic archaeon]|nr:PAS sensor protein [halophilic archaeon]